MSPATHAASASGPFQVQLKILNSCRISSTVSPGIDVTAAPATIRAPADGNPISVSCTDNTPYSIDVTRPVANGTTNGGSGSAASTTGKGAQADTDPADTRRETVTVTVRY